VHPLRIDPPRGRRVRDLLNLLLRITVRWRLGLHIDVPLLRRRMEKLNRQAPVLGHDVRREPAPCNGVAAEWIAPSGFKPDRVLLYVHGGAFVARTPELHAAMISAWCAAFGARALMVDYRLAPEHPYPAALDDCHAVYRWLLQQGIAPAQIVIGGDSAGANLALATLQRLKAEETPLPACAVLLSPFLDFSLGGNSVLDNALADPVFTLAFGIGIRACYAQPRQYLDPGVSPLFGDFAGLPPLLFQVGSAEMLLDDSVRAAARAQAAGVPVQLEIWEHLPHVFQAIAALPQAREAAKSILHFVASHTGWVSHTKGLT
jgi:acetyl esterase/lipase